MSFICPDLGDMQKTIYSTEYAQLCRWLRERRNEKGLTMREAAKRIEVIHSWVGKVEQGERRLDVVEFVRYCKALGLDPHEGLDRITELTITTGTAPAAAALPPSTAAKSPALIPVSAASFSPPAATLPSSTLPPA